MDARTQKIIRLYQAMPGAPAIPFYQGEQCWGDVEGNDHWEFCAAIVDAGPPLPPAPPPPAPPVYQTSFNCPHCGEHQRHGFKSGDSPTIVYCYEDEGGCGVYFVVEAQIRITVEPITHKIEGLNPISPRGFDEGEE